MEVGKYLRYHEVRTYIRKRKRLHCTFLKTERDRRFHADKDLG